VSVADIRGPFHLLDVRHPPTLVEERLLRAIKPKPREPTLPYDYGGWRAFPPFREGLGIQTLRRQGRRRPSCAAEMSTASMAPEVAHPKARQMMLGKSRAPPRETAPKERLKPSDAIVQGRDVTPASLVCRTLPNVWIYPNSRHPQARKRVRVRTRRQYTSTEARELPLILTHRLYTRLMEPSDRTRFASTNQVPFSGTMSKNGLSPHCSRCGPSNERSAGESRSDAVLA
jgi:hypothetical protein